MSASCIDVIEVPANCVSHVWPEGKLSDGELHEAAAFALFASLACVLPHLLLSERLSCMRLTGIALLLSSGP